MSERVELTRDEVRALGSRLAGVLDGHVDEAAEWLRPTVERIIANRLVTVEAERDALRATVGRVEALADTWDAEGWDYPAGAAYDLRAALAPQDAQNGPQGGEQGSGGTGGQWGAAGRSEAVTRSGRGDA